MDYNIFPISFRHDITFKDVSGESEEVTKEMTTPWDLGRRQPYQQY